MQPPCSAQSTFCIPSSTINNMQRKISGKRSTEAQKYRTLYSTKHLKTLRRQALTRDKYRCQHSGCCAYLQVGGDHPCSAVVHHLEPHKGDLEPFFDLDNLQSVCWTCHSTTYRVRKPIDTIAPLELMVGLSIQGIRFTHFEYISRNV